MMEPRETVTNRHHMSSSENYIECDSLLPEFGDLCRSVRQAMAAAIAGSGNTGLVYHYSERGLLCLGCAAERLLNSLSLNILSEAIQNVSALRVACTSYTTPQLRVYVGDNARDLLRDETHAKYHYILPLNVPDGEMLLLERKSPLVLGRFIERKIVSRVWLKPNSIIIHSGHQRYAIPQQKRSLDPREGLVFIEGYAN